MAKMDFDQTTVEPVGEFAPLPADEYMAVISASENKPVNGKPHNQYLQLVFDIVDEEYAGRKVFERLNVLNDNETAQKIGKQKLSAICLVLGITQIKDTEQLHDKPIIIVVGINPAKGDYGPSNKITGYKRFDGASVKEVLKEREEGKTAPVAPKGAAAPAAGAKKAKPWQQGKK
jgi:hypothetical protein